MIKRRHTLSTANTPIPIAASYDVVTSAVLLAAIGVPLAGSITRINKIFHRLQNSSTIRLPDPIAPIVLHENEHCLTIKLYKLSGKLRWFARFDCSFILFFFFFFFLSFSFFHERYRCKSPIARDISRYDLRCEEEIISLASHANLMSEEE